MKSLMIGFLLMIGLASVSFSQMAVASIKVEVDGKVTEMSAADLAKLPRKEVTGKDHDGKESTFSGVEIREILTAVGAKLGAEIRGKRLAEYLLVEAADGYRAVFAIAELDPEFSPSAVILADKQDGKAFDEKKGKFQVIAPADKRHGRWVRQVIRLVLKSDSAQARGELDPADSVRARAYREFYSFLSNTDTSFREPERIYVGVDENRNPSGRLISELSNSGRMVRKLSDAGPLTRDGSVIEKKPKSLLIILSKIKWIDQQTVEVGVWQSCGNMCGLGCRYQLVKNGSGWEPKGQPSCTIS